MDISRMRTNQKLSLILFVVGAGISVILDIFGVTSLSTEAIFYSTLHLQVSTFVVLPIAFAISGLIIGLLSKSTFSATIYGACFGQCQTLFPLIAFYFVLHKGTDFEIWWRALCGIPLSMAFSGAAFSAKVLLKNVFHHK